MAFGFLKAPFKLVSGAARGVAKGVSTAARGVAKGASFAVRKVAPRALPIAAGIATGGIATGAVAAAGQIFGGGGGGPPDISTPVGVATPGFVTRQGAPPFQSSSRFSLSNTLAALEAEARRIGGQVLGTVQSSAGRLRTQVAPQPLPAASPAPRSLNLFAISAAVLGAAGVTFALARR